MLSRTAANLYWLARYIERAECTARLMDMGQRITMVPGANHVQEWESILQATGQNNVEDAGEAINQQTVVQHLILDRDCPCSVHACIARARSNGKAVRTALTQDTWEALNEGWRYLETLDAASASQNITEVIDWVRCRTAMFRGSIDTSMLRQDAYEFVKLGGMIERADSTLRLLSVKYFVLLPERDVIGGGRDHYQWTAILRAVSGLRAYHHAYKTDYSPWRIADFLITNMDFPRSVLFCYQCIWRALEGLEDRYAQTHPVHSLIRSEVDRLRRRDIDDIFSDGLHEFLVRQIAITNRIGCEISSAYLFDL